MTFTIGEIITILSFLGGLVAVWVRNEVSVARVKERLIQYEKNHDTNTTYYEKEYKRVEAMIKEQYSSILTELKEVKTKLSVLEIDVAKKLSNGVK